MNPSAGHTSVLLLHGLCSTPDELLPVRQALVRSGYRVLPLCIPGYSYDVSDMAPQTPLTTPYRSWIAQVRHAVRRQRSDGQRVVLVGLSAGATLALAATQQAGVGVDGLVLMSTPLRFDGWAVPRYHFLLPLALYTPLGRYWQYRETPPYGVKNLRVRGWIERELASRRVSRAGAAVIGVAQMREHDRLRRAVCRSLSNFPCPPVLALHAREDEVASPANVRLLQQRLHTPSFRSVLLPDSHHMITLDNDRAEVVRETLAFVARIIGVFNPARAPALQADTHVLEHL